MSVIDELYDASSAQKSDRLSKLKRGQSLDPPTIFKESSSQNSELMSLDSIDRGKIIPVFKQSSRYFSLRPVDVELNSSTLLPDDKGL